MKTPADHGGQGPWTFLLPLYRRRMPAQVRSRRTVGGAA
jgi:hypothetical protein